MAAAVPAGSSSPPAAGAWIHVCNLSEIPVGGAKCSDVLGRPIVLFRTAKGSSSKSSSSSPSSPPCAAPSADSSAQPPATLCEIPSDSSRLWALDRVCYHMGGPLDQGDIEDLQGSLVVTCPWHRYKITLQTGEGVYQAAPGQWKSKGVRQRTHRVSLLAAPASEGGESEISVRVQLDSSEEDIASDSYNEPSRYRALQERMNKQPTTISMNTSSWNPQQQNQGGVGGAGGGAGGGGGSGSGVPGPGGYKRSGEVFAANRAAANASKQ